jgi:hypothetical protein
LTFIPTEARAGRTSNSTRTCSVGHFTGAQLFLQILRQGVQDRRIELLSDDGDQLVTQASADLVRGIRLQVGGPTFPRDDHRFHGIPRIHVAVGVLRSGEEQTAQETKTAEPGMFHAGPKRTLPANSKLLWGKEIEPGTLCLAFTGVEL